MRQQKALKKKSGGALFAYDRDSLQKLLNQNPDILNETGWPKQADEFVVRIATTYADHPLLFDLIADAFGDYQNPCRTYIPKSPKPLSVF